MTQEYDVFICHRGETKRNFVSVLDGMLRSKGITCFVDYRMATGKKRNIVSVLRGMLLWKSITPFAVGYGKVDAGSALNSDIVQAIENSRVHVILLSPNFACSRRCLEEVVNIMKIQGSPGTSDAPRKPTVLPIFYDTEPSTVRHQKTDTAYDLNQVQGSSTVEERKRWVEPFTTSLFCMGANTSLAQCWFQWKELYAIVKIVEASAKNIPPWNYGLNKNQFKSIVNEVVQTLNERGEEIVGAIDFPVGLAQRSSDIECSILDCVSGSENSVQCFGLVGMGGIGKTTLARSIFNKIRSQFERSFFSLNTRAEVQAKGTLGLVDVQKKIITKLLNIRSDDVKIDNEEHGKMVLSSKVKHINALIVLDDVDDARHLEAFCEPLQSSLGPKSVIIITTRDQKIVDSAKSTMIFDIERLDEEMSKWLFYWHAFMKPKPPADLEIVSHSVIKACQGLPLSLKIIGSHLYGNSDREYWQESFNLLQKGKKGIFDVLRISFDGLDRDEKEAFLDICCFLINEDIEMTCMILKACYGVGTTHLNTLKNKCLITTYVDKYAGRRSRIGMHDQLRDMGRHIIREEQRDRAWDEETANEILQILRCCRAKSSRLQRVHSFMFCIIRWLRWEGAPFEELPQGLCSTNIRVLELRRSEIRGVPVRQTIWKCRRRIPLAPLQTASLPNLEHLDLSSWNELKRLDMTSKQLKLFVL
ncbi:hypothetical protein KP509_1Z167800 [Ceratopteris richardii]|nr:hypothetical protein KP509_1Z167800 [Ceratopteris richardii]